MYNTSPILFSNRTANLVAAAPDFDWRQEFTLSRMRDPGQGLIPFECNYSKDTPDQDASEPVGDVFRESEPVVVVAVAETPGERAVEEVATSGIRT